MIPDTVVPQAGGPVSAEALCKALDSRIYKEWAASLEPGFVVQSVIVTAVDVWGGRVGFVRLAVKTADVKFEQVVELRGGTVTMLIELKCEGALYTILVKQPRLATGQRRFVEVPAGMIDDGKFKGKAAQEIEEELGLKIPESALIDMTALLPGSGASEIYFSPGLLDERGRFYLVRLEVSHAELKAMQGKATGKADEGEDIVLMIIPMADLPKYARDMKSLCALWLYQNCLRESA